MQLVVVCLLGWVFLDQAKMFADKFAKGADLDNMGRSVGGAFAQAGKKAASATAKAGKAVGKAGLQVGDHFVGSRLRQMRNNYRINKVKNGADRSTTDADGNKVFERTTRNFLGQKVTRLVTVGPDGKELSSAIICAMPPTNIVWKKS